MLNEQPDQAAIDVAQAILSQACGSRLKLEAGASLGGSSRSHVTRCRVLDAPASAPHSVVVKQALAQANETYDPESAQGPATRLFNEWASLQFLNECFEENSPVPRFYGGDRTTGIIVMEDLGAGQGLDALLLGDDAMSAETAMLALFRVVGRMHAVSAGKGSHYRAMRDALGPRHSGFLDNIAEYAGGLTTWVEALGLKAPGPLDAELKTCLAMAHDPGPFTALIHCDPCPDNCLLTSTGMKLLDFEFGQFGLALWDGAYARIHFPTCWCVNRIPPPVVERVEAAYRLELTAGCPQAADDTQFGQAIGVSCACALLMTLAWAMPGILEQDGEWGIATQRQRVVVRLDALAGASEQWGHLPALGTTARQMASRLRDLWLPAMEEMPLYPAFR